MRIAIYDMDGTLLSGSTFTPFLTFGARRLAPARLALLPLWVGLMIGHKLGLIGRTALKHQGMRIMLGRSEPARLVDIAGAFARERVTRAYPGALRMIRQDAEDGWMQVVATAAYGLYAQQIARGLGIERVIATQWEPEGEPHSNCYGPEKLARVKAWLSDQGIDRAAAHIRFVSDSFADAPMLDWADEAWFVTANPRMARKARARGWQPVDFSR